MLNVVRPNECDHLAKHFACYGYELLMMFIMNYRALGLGPGVCDLQQNIF